MCKMRLLEQFFGLESQRLYLYSGLEHGAGSSLYAPGPIAL